MESSPLAVFLAEMFTHGKGPIHREADLNQGVDQAQRILKENFDAALESLPDHGPQPVFRPQIALAAARFFYRAAEALVDRTQENRKVSELFSAPPAPPRNRDDLLSQDLTFQHLSALHRMAHALNPADPLTKNLILLVPKFPYATIGIPYPHERDLTLIEKDPLLWSLYLDRILERGEETSLNHPAVRHGLREILGLHGHLSPGWASRLSLGD